MQTGYYRTSIKTDNDRIEKGYYHLRYRAKEYDKYVSISAKSLDELKTKVLNQGFEWKVIDEYKAKQTKILDDKMSNIRQDFENDLNKLEDEMDNIKINFYNKKRMLQQSFREEMSNNLVEHLEYIKKA